MQAPDNQLTEEEIRAALETELFSTLGSMSRRLPERPHPSEPAILQCRQKFPTRSSSKIIAILFTQCNAEAKEDIKYLILPQKT